MYAHEPLIDFIDSGYTAYKKRAEKLKQQLIKLKKDYEALSTYEMFFCLSPFPN